MNEWDAPFSLPWSPSTSAHTRRPLPGLHQQVLRAPALVERQVAPELTGGDVDAPGVVSQLVGDAAGDGQVGSGDDADAVGGPAVGVGALLLEDKVLPGYRANRRQDPGHTDEHTTRDTLEPTRDGRPCF